MEVLNRVKQIPCRKYCLVRTNMKTKDLSQQGESEREDSAVAFVLIRRLHLFRLMNIVSVQKSNFRDPKFVKTLSTSGFCSLVRTVGCVIKNLRNMSELTRKLRSATDSVSLPNPGKEYADLKWLILCPLIFDDVC